MHMYNNHLAVHLRLTQYCKSALLEFKKSVMVYLHRQRLTFLTSLLALKVE